MSEKIYYYPIYIRLWHVINAVMFLLLIITGFSMQYTTPESPFIRFDIAVRLHNIGGLTVTFNYLLFLTGNIISGNSQHYRIKARGFVTEFMGQVRYYLFGIFKGAPHPYPVSRDRKFNPLQKLTYAFAMYFGMPILILTGLALYFPKIFNLLGLGSLVIADIVHVLMGIVMTMFMCIHIYFCTVGHTLTSNFKSMINGWHDVEH